MGEKSRLERNRDWRVIAIGVKSADEIGADKMGARVRRFRLDGRLDGCHRSGTVPTIRRNGVRIELVAGNVH